MNREANQKRMDELIRNTPITTMHRIKLEIEGQVVKLTGPACTGGFHEPYSRATFSSSRLRINPPLYEQDHNKPWSGIVALGSWRHQVRGALREFHANKAYDGEQNPAILSQGLVFEFQGNDYSLDTVDSIPKQPDFIHEVGSFDQKSDTLLAIDPCYTNLSDGVQIPNALQGKWNAAVLYQDDKAFFGAGWRPGMLVVTHESLGLTEERFKLDWYESTDDTAGVDSGQCGFFDMAQYPTDKPAHETKEGTFYSLAIEATSTEESTYGEMVGKHHDCGMMAQGVNSCTFYGDGGYLVLVRRNEEGQAVAAMLVFNPFMLPGEGEDNEEEEDDVPV